MSEFPRAPRRADRRQCLAAVGTAALLWLAPLAAGARTLPIMTSEDASAALLAAATAGDVPAIERALASGAVLETRDARGRTPVLLATAGGHVAAAQALIARL